MHKPDVLILDEPTSGLDPLLQRTFQALVAETSAAGATILLSSHVLSELEHVAGRVAMIRDGKLLAVEAIEDLKRRGAAAGRRHLRRSRAGGGRRAAARRERRRGPRRDRRASPSTARWTRWSRRSREHEVVTLSAQEPDLEELFLDRYADG